MRRTVSKKCKDFEAKSCIKSAIPVLDWLPNYKWKDNILGDVAAGITVAVMHIPQGKLDPTIRGNRYAKKLKDLSFQALRNVEELCNQFSSFNYGSK